MFTSWPKFIALLQLGLVLFSSSGRVHGENVLNPGNFSCGYTRNHAKENRFNGNVFNNYPMIVALATVMDHTSYKFGQGTIIDSRHVITTDSCSMLENDTYVVVGPYLTRSKGLGSFSLPILDYDIRHPTLKMYKTKEVVSYEPETDYYVITILPALLILEKEIIFNNEVGPACLPLKFSDKDLLGARVNLIGWPEEQEQFGTLQKFAYTIIYYYYSNQMCLCSNDSNVHDPSEGAGVFYKDSDGKIYIVGLVGVISKHQNAVLSALSLTSIMKWIAEEIERK